MPKPDALQSGVERLVLAGEPYQWLTLEVAATGETVRLYLLSERQFKFAKAAAEAGIRNPAAVGALVSIVRYWQDYAADHEDGAEDASPHDRLCTRLAGDLGAVLAALDGSHTFVSQSALDAPEPGTEESPGVCVDCGQTGIAADQCIHCEMDEDVQNLMDRDRE